MDMHWKMLLQLVFPAYVIFLVVMVIIISEHSKKFARFIGRKNPVATLGTLILLSHILCFVSSLLHIQLDKYMAENEHCYILATDSIASLHGPFTWRTQICSSDSKAENMLKVRFVHVSSDSCKD